MLVHIVLREYLQDYGLSADQIKGITSFYNDLDSLLNAEDYEIAAVGDMKIEDVRKLKNYLSDRKKGIARDFLRRWGKVLSEENVENAYEEYDKLSKLQPNSPVVWQIKGELLEKMGKNAEAREAFKKAKKLYEDQGEIPPSFLEEKLQGMSYKSSSHGNGIGLINGLGFQNGKSKVNGFSNGLSNGVSGGFKNGIINGSGLVNGAGRIGRRPDKKVPPIVRFSVAILLVIVLIYAPLMGVFFFEKGIAYEVDGNFQEWSSSIPYYNLKSAPSIVNITEVKFHSTTKGLYFFVESQEEFFKMSSGVYIFIDMDMDSKTGYSVGNIGAEYMAEIYGWNESIQGRELYFFNSSDQNDFSKFVPLESISAVINGNKMEGFIPHPFHEFRSVVIFTNYAGAGDLSYIPKYGEEMFYVAEENYSPVIPLNQDTAILKMKIYSLNDVKIQNLTFEFNGTAAPIEMDKIAIYEDDGNGEFDSKDTMISDAWNVKNIGYIVFSNLNLKVKNATLFLVVRCSHDYLKERAISAVLLSLNASLPYWLDDFVDGGSYIYSIPAEPHVDGSFLDWKIKKSDPVGDVVSISGHMKKFDENLDIVNYSSYLTNHLLFYVNVNGKLLGGTDCPLVRMFTLPDSDRDTVPDRFDLYPHDFNNDGIPDNESFVVVNGEKLPDVDKDGVADYPYGPDMWLNTTIPDNFPKPYAGKEVHVYIGPTPAEEIYGYDVLDILINSDSNTSTGYSPPQYPIGADYKVELYGRDGKVYNASLYAYSHGWRFVRNIEYFKGYHSIELDSGIAPARSSSLIILSDWDSDRDISNSPLITPSTKSNYEHKQLHLHYDNTTQSFNMDTHPGGTGYYINIPANYYAEWHQIPVFAKNFSIVANPKISLYLVPHPYIFLIWEYIPGMNVSLWKYNDSTGLEEIGYDYNPDIESEGWYNFTIKNTTSLYRGEALYLRTEVSGYRRTSIDVYFNSTQYDSQIDLPTDTYVNVDWIKTYNSSSETYLFERGESVIIKSKISDPFGSGDISGARISVSDPNGTMVVDNVTMSVESSSDAYSIFTYSLIAPNSPGKYTISVLGEESNGVMDEGQYQFFVRAEMGVSMFPDTTEFGNPGENVSFNLTILNYGNVDDGYYIKDSESSEHFPFVMYIGDSLAARDDDGDGVWNWINSSWERDDQVFVHLDADQEMNITVIKSVPYGKWGKTDLLVLNAVSVSNSSVNDSVRIRTNVPVLSVKKVLFLNGSSSLSLKHGDNEQSQTIYYDNSYSWTFPKVYYDVNITGYITVHLYMNAQSSYYSGVAITASLYADSSLIGDDEIIGEKNAKWYTFTITPQTSVIPAGSQITLTVSVKGYGTSTTVYYDSNEHPSNITIPTSDFIRIRYLKLFNSTGESNNFSAGEDMRVETRITSPFGTDDIGDAYLNITDSMGDRKLNSQKMQLVSSSGGDKIYQYTYSIPHDAWSGFWKVRVDTHDDPLIYTNASTQFFIPWDVNITPNHNTTTNVSSQDREFTFEHTITNTGLGANIFEIKATSQNGFDIKLYIDGNLAAEDYNGDGVWDYVNSNYDSDGDGNPDTGILLAGESMDIEISVVIPANFTGNESVDVEAYSFLSQGINDHAYDKIQAVPELSDLVIIAPIMLVVALIKRKGRFTLF